MKCQACGYECIEEQDKYNPSFSNTIKGDKRFGILSFYVHKSYGGKISSSKEQLNFYVRPKCKTVRIGD